jgi:serine/threonine protein kinase
MLDTLLDTQQLLAERYQLQQRLGRTGIGRQTWLAIDRTTQQQVIVKLLAFNPQMQWHELKLFEREAQVLRSLDHPRIPQYRDYFSIEGSILWFGLVQDYIPGASLQALLDNGEVFTEAEIRQVAIDLLQVLNDLHQIDPPMLHRDIKPSNIIRGEDGLIYLVDFGAVQNQMPLTGATFTVVGTCGYTPLEQFWGRAVPASDLYALGATLIHLTTGISPADLPQRNSRIQFAESVSLAPFFTAWLEKLTEPAIEKRFHRAADALQALRLEKTLTPRRWRMPQPSGSRIQLWRSLDALRIHIAPPNNLGKLGMIPKVGGVAFLLCLWLVMAMATASGLSGIVLAAIMMTSFIYMVAVQLCEQVDLFFEPESLHITHRSFRITPKKHQEIAIDHIAGVFLQKTDHQHQVMLRVRPGADVESALAPSLCEIGGHLSEADSLWLIQVIQDWLHQQD